MTPILLTVMVAIVPFSLSETPEIIRITHPGLSEHRDTDRSGETQVKQYQGDVIRMEDGRWIIRDTAGQEVHLQVDRQTAMSGKQPQLGDRIEAYVNPSGHTDSVRTLSEE